MVSQQVETADTIAALRRKIQREKANREAVPASHLASNRGHKLQKGCRYVKSSSLSFRLNAHGFTEPVCHAGYERNILARRPRADQQVLDEEDLSDVDADDEDPYADIQLEILLRPLTHPSELAHHPSLRHAYTDLALPEMCRNTEVQLREARANLWRAKNLYRHFTGDQPWMPCGLAEQRDDWDLFEPHPNENRSKRRKLEHEDVMANGIDRQDHIETENGKRYAVANDDGDQENNAHNMESRNSIQDKDTSMAEIAQDQLESEDIEKSVEEYEGAGRAGLENENLTDHDHNKIADEVQEDEESGESSPAPPSRRITRALAAEVERSTPSVHSSPAISATSSAFEPHPTFLLPPSVATAHGTHVSGLPMNVAHSGLPLEELLETRKLLSMYIQKTEETIRGLEGIYGKLVKAKRRRDTLLEWCIAEAHVGEMSDGEDWIDAEAWGLGREDLRKGKDEDAVPEVNIDLLEGSGVVMGGRKGKRRRVREGRE